MSQAEPTAERLLTELLAEYHAGTVDTLTEILAERAQAEQLAQQLAKHDRLTELLAELVHDRVPW